MTEEFNRKTLNDKINTLMKAQKYDEALEICNTALTQKDLYDDVFSAKLIIQKVLFYTNIRIMRIQLIILMRLLFYSQMNQHFIFIEVLLKLPLKIIGEP